VTYGARCYSRDTLMCNLSHNRVCNVIQFLLVKYISAIDIHHKLMQMYGDGIMRVQHVGK
jgi:hypothetical protein